MSICDYFKWSLSDLRSLSIADYMGVRAYLKKVDRENKKALRKSKSKRR